MTQPARSNSLHGSSQGAATRPTVLRLPQLTPAGITWRTSGSNVQISIEIENPSPRSTERGQLMVEAAALGAFVPSRALARIPVPALDPGGRRRLQFTVPPIRLPAPDALGKQILALYKGRVGDLEVELLSQVDWAGNLNVWFRGLPREAVEVHRALDLCVQVGRTAGIGVYLPTHFRDYEISIQGGSANWPTRIVPIQGHLCLLAVRPRFAGLKADIAIHVRRRSDDRVVPVEFSFESVTRPSDLLGCVTI